MGRALCVRVSFKGKELSLRTFQSDRITIGRDADCDIRLDNVGVSRQHASIDWQGVGYLLRDLGSSNGTVVGDKPVTAWPIRDGDRARIAKFDLEFRLSPEAPTAESQLGHQPPTLRERDTMLAVDDRAVIPPAPSESPSQDVSSAPRRSSKLWILIAGATALVASIVLLQRN